MRKITNIDEYMLEVKLWLQKFEVSDFEKSLIDEIIVKEAMIDGVSPRGFVIGFLNSKNCR